jgi:hypothetical protein
MGVSASNHACWGYDQPADPDGAGYDEESLATMNAKLNALVTEEISEDKILFEP